MTDSVLTRKQVRKYGPRFIAGWGTNAQIKAEVRYDDECGNGHNSFAITGEIYRPGRRDCEACGCLHEEIARVFPELAPFIKWHLSDTDGPMHYIANTLYWLGYDRRWSDGKPDSPPNLEHARNTAVWPDMPETLIAPDTTNDGVFANRRNEVQQILEARVEDLRKEFQQAVESFGFTW
jgi:hypothetical protein